MVRCPASTVGSQSPPSEKNVHPAGSVRARTAACRGTRKTGKLSASDRTRSHGNSLTFHTTPQRPLLNGTTERSKVRNSGYPDYRVGAARPPPARPGPEQPETSPVFPSGMTGSIASPYLNCGVATLAILAECSRWLRLSVSRGVSKIDGQLR
jgi:hypothetical protein